MRWPISPLSYVQCKAFHLNGVQTELKCKPNVKRCKRFVFVGHSPLLHHNTLKTKAITLFQADHILTRFVFPPLNDIISFAGADKIKSSYPAYKNKKYFSETIGSFSQLLKEEAKGATNLKTILDTITGVGVIPIMTIHKSKGLEYHTVIFMGLEDGAFWSYDKQPDEDKCAFFVALSRAKERVAFTFSRNRNGRAQSLTKIEELFKSLEDSKKVAFQEIK